MSWSSSLTGRHTSPSFIVWRVGLGVFFILMGTWSLTHGEHWVSYAFLVLGAVSVAVALLTLARRSRD
jgi:hypothetical protein